MYKTTQTKIANLTSDLHIVIELKIKLKKKTLKWAFMCKHGLRKEKKKTKMNLKQQFLNVYSL